MTKKPKPGYLVSKLYNNLLEGLAMRSRKETLADGYYALALVALDRFMDICRQAGLKFTDQPAGPEFPKMNEVWVDKGADMEGMSIDAGDGRTFSCRAARYHGADIRSNAGLVVAKNQGGLFGRARISVLNEPAHGKWLFYAQIQPGCRSSEFADLCTRLSIDTHVKIDDEVSENNALTMTLTIAQWAARIVDAERLKGAIRGSHGQFV